MSFCIAIDGPAGAGKSTIAKRLAKELHMIYVDTGAMYRAMAYHLLRKGTDFDSQAQISADCQDADITISYDNGEQVIWLNGENVNPYLRSEAVSEKASVSSTNADVRKRLVLLQRKLAQQTDLVMDGRDIGTCVLPDAQLKIYLTASSHTRAMRRYLELKQKGIDCELDEIEHDIQERDYRDMHRDISPLRKADDAIVLDSSDLTVNEVVTVVLGLAIQKREG